MIDIPAHWRECLVGALGSSISGLSFRPQDAREAPGPDLIACFRTSNIQEYLEEHDVLFVPRNLLRSERQLLQDGDILISTANSDNLVGKCVITENLSYEATLGGFITAFRVNRALVIPRFFYYWMSSPLIKARLRSLARKTTNIANLAMSDFAKVKIPLPPLSEQRRIVEILQEAEEIRRLHAEAEDKAAELAPAIFESIFGTPSEWNDAKKLREIVKIVGGGTPSRRVEHYYTGKIPWATSKDIKTLYLSDTEEHVTEEAIQLSATNIVPEGTVLVVVKSKILAHSLPVSINQVPMCFGQDIKGLIPIKSIYPEFLVYSLQSQLGRILARARGANTEGLTLEALKTLDVPMPLPEKVEQFRIACEEIYKLNKDSIVGNRLISLADMSLSANAFSGFLTADWRETYHDMLASEARDRDAVLKEEGAALTVLRRATVKEMEEVFELPADGIYAELNSEQRFLLREIGRMVGGVRYARYFSTQTLGQYLPKGLLRRNPQAIEGHLAVLAARGLIIPVSREEQTEDTGMFVFGNAYRLPLQTNEQLLTTENGEDIFTEAEEELFVQVGGDKVRLSEMERLATQLGKERSLQ
jgi:type I restriction enzyme S subunit